MVKLEEVILPTLVMLLAFNAKQHFVRLFYLNVNSRCSTPIQLIALQPLGNRLQCNTVSKRSLLSHSQKH